MIQINYNSIERNENYLVISCIDRDVAHVSVEDESITGCLLIPLSVYLYAVTAKKTVSILKSVEQFSVTATQV